MKFFKKIVRKIKRLFRPVAVAAGGAFCVVALNAPAQLTPTTLLQVTNMPPIVTAGATSNQVSVITINNNSGLALSWQFNVSSGTSAGVLLLWPTVDGTNYDTVPWQLIRTATGTTDQIVTTNWDANKLKGYVALKVMGMTNANGGTLTNKSLQFNRPNS